MLVFADEFVEVLKEADEDHEKGARDADEEQRDGYGHGHVGEGKH